MPRKIKGSHVYKSQLLGILQDVRPTYLFVPNGPVTRLEVSALRHQLGKKVIAHIWPDEAVPHTVSENGDVTTMFTEPFTGPIVLEAQP